jgi:hypothetical protein
MFLRNILSAEKMSRLTSGDKLNLLVLENERSRFCKELHKQRGPVLVPVVLRLIRLMACQNSCCPDYSSCAKKNTHRFNLTVG